MLLAALGLHLAWLARHAGGILADDTGLILFCLAHLFAAIMLLRRKPAASASRPPPSPVILAVAGVIGAVAALVGLIAPIRQLEWLGLLTMLYACLRWALPPSHAPDVRWALLLLYWAHPLPSVIIGRTQLLLQWLSVAGSEWVLQALNVRVWADGFCLRTGSGSFGVPEACSGLRAASTVFVSVLGVSVLLRFRWWEAAGVLLLGLAQVVALNIARIAFMVLWAPRMPPEWAQTFLHDTLGIFLLIAVFAVQVEASAWKAWRTRRQRVRSGIISGELDGPERATILPAAWRRLVKWGVPVALVIVAVLGLAFAIYKHRPYHRVAMMTDVLDVLSESDPETAERGVKAALKLSPGNTTLLEMQGGILVRRRKFQEALDVLQSIESPSLTASVLKSWSLMALSRHEEAAAVVAALPPSAQNLPGVAMVKAEYAAVRGDPGATATELRKVGTFHVYQPRVRTLFPFLAAHEQWDTIVAVDGRGPYPNAPTALIGLYACIRAGDLAAAGDVMRRAGERWPEDVRFLSYYFLLALDRPGGEWEAPLTRNFLHNLRALQADQLAGHLADAFRLARPDLAWMAFARLQEIDPKDPSLDLAIAEFGPSWLTFRKHDLAMEDRDPTTLVDVFPLYRWSRDVRAFAPFWRRVPAVQEIASGEMRTLRRTHLERCLGELLRRERADEMTVRLDTMLPGVLAALERYDEAHAHLDTLAAKYPARRVQAALQGAFFYHSAGKWQEAYEKLLVYEAQVPLPNLRASILKITTLMNLGLGVYALDEVRALRSRFPESFQLDRAESAIWDVFGFKEEALFILNRGGVDLESRAAVQLLYDTGRLRAAEQMSTVHGVQIEDVRRSTAQPFVLPPAALAIARRWDAPLDITQMDAEALQEETRAKDCASPFVRQLRTLMVNWYRQRGAAPTGDIELWLAIGRNAGEKTAALKQLIMLEARQKHYDNALVACRKALALNPESVMMWRIAIALSEGDATTVAEARTRFPGDPEIWLADLAVRLRDPGDGKWVEPFATEAVAQRRYSPGTLVRAGTALMQKGFSGPASVLAKAAIRHGQGLVAADVLGLSCALLQRDRQWALACALGGIEHAENPVPFYKALVLVKPDQDTPDADMVRALEYLREHAPKEKQWGERLAEAYFERGDTRRSLAIFSEVISDDVKGVRVKSLLMAAEAARLQGDTQTAISVLQSAHAIYPTRLSILNNLIYTLAQNPSTLPKAVQLLPKLLDLADESFAVYDTVATVYLKSGRLEEANRYMQKALTLLDENGYGAMETRLSAAEIDFRMGRMDDARSHIKIIQAAPEVSSLVETGVRDLLQKINRQR